jgi:membrane-bound metal-dependent hydrolase YbcI (DUF457 family)
MPSTLAHALAPAIVSHIRAPALSSVERWRFAFVGACFGNIADLDILPGFLWWEHWHAIHRFWGHNVFVGVFWATLGTPLVRRLWPQLGISQTVLWISFWISSHWILDGMSFPDASGVYAGVPLLWPFTHSLWRIPIEMFRGVPLGGDPSQILRYLVSPDFWIQNVWREIVGSVVFAIAAIAAHALLLQLFSIFRRRLKSPQTTQKT